MKVGGSMKVESGMGDFMFSILSETDKKLPFYLIGAGSDFHQELDPHERPIGHPHFQWIQVIKGTGEITIGNKTQLVGKNQGIFIYPDIPHEYHAVESPWIVNWFSFNGYQILDFLKQINLNDSAVYSVVQSEVFTGKIRKSLDLLKSGNSMKSLEASVIVYDFLISFLKYAHLGDDDSAMNLHSRLNRVFYYIDKNYSKSISIEELSELISITPQYLCLLFKKIIQQRPMEYLNNVRINKSKDTLLKHPHFKIDEISRKAGYESTSYYCSIFKKIEGISPGKFRELHLNQKYLHQQ